VILNAVKDISQIFPNYLFWNVNPKNLDIQDDKDFIVPRALMATTVDTFTKDIEPLEQLYSIAQIVSVLQKIKERISNEVCMLVTRRYHVKLFLSYQ